jgi:hypothetical protein
MSVNTFHADERPWLFGLNRPIYAEVDGKMRETDESYPFEFHYWGENRVDAFENFFADYGTEDHLDLLRFTIDQFIWVHPEPTSASARVYYRGAHVKPHWLTSKFERDLAPVHMQHNFMAIRKDIATSLAGGIIKSAHQDYLMLVEEEASRGQSSSK